MILSITLLIVGFLGLIFGGNWLVDGASFLAKKNNIPDIVIGLTIVAFGTSAPELIVNSVASYYGFSDLILGNIIGSNNLNLFIILGIAGLIYPINVQLATIKKEIPISFLIAVLLLFLATDFFYNQNSFISRFDGIILLTIFGGFVYYLFSQIKSIKTVADTKEYASNQKIWILIIAGFIGLTVGGKLVVDNSISIATSLGISQKIIGLTILAIGTSLPELITSILAAIKKNSDIAIGNVIGSNIFNILLIIPVSALINPIKYNHVFDIDFMILIGGTIFLMLAMLTGKRKTLDRWESSLMICFYLAYTGYLLFNEV